MLSEKKNTLSSSSKMKLNATLFTFTLITLAVFAQTTVSTADPLSNDAQIEVSVFDPGPDSFVSVPGGAVISAMINAYGTSANTEQLRQQSMATPPLSLYDHSSSTDPWIIRYGDNGTYQLSYLISVPAMFSIFTLMQRTNRNSYMAYFQGNLWVVGAWAFCPGPPWSDPVRTGDFSMTPCSLETWNSIPSQPWINQSLGTAHSYARGAAGLSRDGGKSWEIVVADPRLARFGSEIIVVNGSDGTIGAAMCLVGGSIIPSNSMVNLKGAFPISDSVLCTYDGSHWWENTPLPTPSAEHSLESIGSSILVIGGLRPRNNSTTANLDVYQKFMVDPPILVSALSTFPCEKGNPRGSSCIGLKGWAAFLNPPWSRIQYDDQPRCRPVVHFLPGRGTGISTTDTPNFVPKLKIGGGKHLYVASLMQNDVLNDMYYISGDSLAADVKSLANETFESDPFAGTFDTFNNSLVSFNQLGYWTQLEGQLPLALNFGNSFMHQVVFGPDANPCISNGIFTTACDFPLGMPLFIILSGQSVSINYQDTVLSSTSLMPATHLTTEPTYAMNSYDKLVSFYGQRVSELPNFGTGNLRKASDLITDSVLIAPSWNEGQPVLLFLQGGQHLLAAHFARCYFPTCTAGLEYPVTCQHNPRDTYCESCQACTGSSSEFGTFTRRQCSYEISPFSRIPSVLDTVCDQCTNCTDLGSDFSQTCTVTSDATCVARTAPAPLGPTVPKIEQQSQSWRTWLFKTIPLDRQLGPFLEVLATKTLEKGVIFMALLTLAFIMCLVGVSVMSESTLPQYARSENSSNSSPSDNQSISSSDASESSFTRTSSITTRREKLFALCMAYAGLLFALSCESYVTSLPEIFFALMSFLVHLLCGLSGIFFGGIFGIVYNSSRRRLASSPERELSRPMKSQVSAYFFLLFLLFSPLCIGLLSFVPHDLGAKEVKRADVTSGLIGVLNCLLQVGLMLTSLFWFELSLFLWPVFLTLTLALISLVCSIYLLYTRSKRTSVGSDKSVKSMSPSTLTDSDQYTTDTRSTSSSPYDSQINSNAVTMHNSVDSMSSNDFETRSVVESVDTDLDSYSFERTNGLSQIQLFSLACNAEDVTSFSEISEKERQNIARVLFMKRENLRRSSAPSR